MPWVLVVAIVGAVAYALGSSKTPAEHISAAPVPSPLAPATDEQGESPENPGAMQATSQEVLVGVVREHTDVSQYTYLRLATDAGETWAAVYRAPVKDGATVTVEHASAIHKFHSRELGRDFETIWFGMLPGYETAPATGAAAGKGAAAGAAAAVALPPGTLSIADLASKAASLEGTQATVAGKVVKENEGIMGRNWIHIQDGTGSATDKTNDVLVTTDGTAKVGDAIVATGKVRTKQDFGSGYAYDFMLEQASVRPASR
jgi:hypothetical protein